jgi:hypothetical protein
MRWALLGGIVAARPFDEVLEGPAAGQVSCHSHASVAYGWAVASRHDDHLLAPRIVREAADSLARHRPRQAPSSTITECDCTRSYDVP